MKSIYVVFMVVLCNMVAYRGSKVLVSLFSIELGAPQVYIGVLIALYSLVPMLLAFYVGRLGDRLGVRRLMIAGTLGVSLALLLPWLFPTLPMLFLSAGLLGASHVFYNVSVQSLVGLMSAPDERARNFSNYGLVMAGGILIGPLAAGFSIDHFGHAISYLFLAMTPLVAVCIMLGARSIGQQRKKAEKNKDDKEDKANSSSTSLLKNRPLRRTLITSGIVLTGTDLFQFYMPIYGHSIGLSASAIGMILGLFALAAFIVRLVMPAMVKRWTADRVMVGTLFMGAVCYMVFPLCESALLLALLAFVLGLGMGCSQPVSLMLIYERAPMARSGEAMGLRSTINNFMHIVVPLTFGTIGSVFGVAPVFLTNGVLLAAGGWLSAKR